MSKIKPKNIIHNNISYVVKQTDDESYDTYLNRINYITDKSLNNPNMSIEKIINLSYIWRNKMIYNMSYPSYIVRQLRN